MAIGLFVIDARQRSVFVHFDAQPRVLESPRVNSQAGGWRGATDDHGREAGDGRNAGKHTAALDHLATRQCSFDRQPQGPCRQIGVRDQHPPAPPRRGQFAGDGRELLVDDRAAGGDHARQLGCGLFVDFMNARPRQDVMELVPEQNSPMVLERLPKGHTQERCHA
jgi:hypothetical protein